MSSNSVWDDPDLQIGGDYWKPDNVGDSIAGIIQSVRAHRWDDGSVAPQILLITDDGEERTITAGQVRLKAALAEQRPEAGDHISIRLANIEKRTGGKTLKIFDVQVRRGTNTPTDTTAEPAPTLPTGTAVIDPEAAAAALANLTPQQRTALGL